MENNTQRILFWIDKEPKFFGLCKFIQDKYPAQYYGVIDINNRMKEFYENQKLVKFEKTWFYRDCLLVEKQKPNIEYLNLIEKKYNINLWKIIYGDRNFYHFNKYYKFSHDEILFIIEQECKLFDSILKEVSPDFFIISRPDFHHMKLFQEMARSSGIKLLILDHPRIGYRSLITDKPDEIDDLDSKVQATSKELRNFNDLREYVVGFGNQLLDNVTKDLRTSKSKQFKASLEFLVNVCNNDYRKHYANYGRTRTQVLKNEGLLPLKRWYRKKYINKHSSQKIPDNQKFIYFPLHFEPEETLLIAAPYHTDQISVIKNIAKSIPVEFKLYVKEHPAMVLNGWRPSSFYDKILSMPNVKFIHPSVSNELLLDKCSMVITISGTAAFECGFYGKPSIVFAETLFSHLSFVHQLQSPEELPTALRSSLQKKVNPSEIGEFIDLIENNSIQFDRAFIASDIRVRFLHRKIEDNEMESFMEDYRSEFESLASYHVSKIEQIKKRKWKDQHKEELISKK